MVGVPGKYKGCNTCRLRRVKCDNTRPACRKCLSSGRECGGYERTRTFIVGTIQDGGRCSSHPPRIVKSTKKGKRSPTKVDEDDILDLLTLEPLQPAWDDFVTVTNLGKKHYLQVSALYTALHLVERSGEGSSTSKTSPLRFPPYVPPNPRSNVGQGDFQLKAQCLIYLAPVDESQRDSPDSNKSTIITESVCLFLYEHNWSEISMGQAPWTRSMAELNTVRRLGPENFQTFPNHHFFVRLFRHNAICAALLSRKSTFLSGAEWLTTPWELHPKSSLDKLFDSLVLLPSLLCRADLILASDATVARRLQAQELISTLLNLETSLAQWHVVPEPGQKPDEQSQLYWVEDLETSEGQIPFADSYAFSDGGMALAFIYYWTSLIVLYPCIEKLYNVVFQPAVDVFPQEYPDLPPAPQPINSLKYCTKEIRELAANVCRGLDFALRATVQPDSLLFPLLVVQDFYRDMGGFAGAGGEGQLEVMWCDAFRLRVAKKGQETADVVQNLKWYDMAKY